VPGISVGKLVVVHASFFPLVPPLTWLNLFLFIGTKHHNTGLPPFSPIPCSLALFFAPFLSPLWYTHKAGSTYGKIIGLRKPYTPSLDFLSPLPSFNFRLKHHPCNIPIPLRPSHCYFSPLPEITQPSPPQGLVPQPPRSDLNSSVFPIPPTPPNYSAWFPTLLIVSHSRTRHLFLLSLVFSPSFPFTYPVTLLYKFKLAPPSGLEIPPAIPPAPVTNLFYSHRPTVPLPPPL